MACRVRGRYDTGGKATRALREGQNLEGSHWLPQLVGGAAGAVVGIVLALSNEGYLGGNRSE
jgi:hypothetical protein